MILHKLDTLIEATLVKPIQVCKVDLQPAQPAPTQRLSLGEHEETTAQVIADMIQVWLDWVSTASKVDVMWEVHCVRQELQKEGA